MFICGLLSLANADSPDDVVGTQRGRVLRPVVRQRGGLQCIVGPHHPRVGCRDGRNEDDIGKDDLNLEAKDYNDEKQYVFVCIKNTFHSHMQNSDAWRTKESTYGA